ARLLLEALGVARERSVENLHGDRLAGHLVARAKDLAHAPGADEALDLEAFGNDLHYRPSVAEVESRFETRRDGSRAGLRIPSPGWPVARRRPRRRAALGRRRERPPHGPRA